MSIFGALTTAVSGLTAQAASFSNISDNIANSQTIGYKGVGTDFINYLTESTPTINESGSVVTLPQYTNNVQGAVTQSTDPLALAISGQGFFAVSQAVGATGAPAASSTSSTFNAQQFYTRAGDFSVNADGYLVNSAGNYLDGYAVNASTGIANTTTLAPIQVEQTTSPPVATSKITLSADLPATPAANTPVTSQVSVYDALGTAHTITLNYVQNSASNWTVTASSPDNTGGSTTIGSAVITFGPGSGNPVPPGTIGSITNATGSFAGSTYSAGGTANLTLSPNFGQGTQPINLNLGTFGGSTGLTQYAGTAFDLLGVTQNGLAQGSFSNVTFDTSGDLVVNYTNGQSQTVAKVPLTTFNAPDALQSQNGQAYTATNESGEPVDNMVGSNGAGSLIVGSTEGSNVDIASEFTKLIVAQEAYSANAKVVTTADQLATTTINMKQ